MRLIDAKCMADKEQLELVERSELRDKPYAILSHTWGRQEVVTNSDGTQIRTWGHDNAEILFADVNQAATKSEKPEAWRKIFEACRAAQHHNTDYLWVDTCCFNKDSSAELDESINAMFGWYQQSKVCLVYLADFEDDFVGEKEDLEKCRWFGRGWTLQELVAPKKVEFYNQKWNHVGSNWKTDGSDLTKTNGPGADSDPAKTEKARPDIDLADILRDITGIDGDAFTGKACSSFTVAQRMKWAAKRQTKRPEDRAYSLLGLFGVHMSLIYGVGAEAAFHRLQVEIIQNTTDMTVFAWNPDKSGSGSSESSKFCSMLADSPDRFEKSPSMTSVELERHFSITNKGVSLDASTLRVVPKAMQEFNLPLILAIGFSEDPKSPGYISCHGVYLQKIGSGNYVRYGEYGLAKFKEDKNKYKLQPVPRHQCYITISLPDAKNVLDKSLRKAITVPEEFKSAKPADPKEPSLDWNIRVLNYVPERIWDYRNGLFFRVGYRLRDVVRAVFVELKLLERSFRFAVLLQGDGVTPKAYILDKSNPKWPDVKPVFGPSQRFDSAKWDDLMIDFSHQSEYLDVVAQGRYFRVSASLSKLVKEGNDGRLKLDLDVASDAYHQIEILKGRVEVLEQQIQASRKTRPRDEDDGGGSESGRDVLNKRTKK